MPIIPTRDEEQDGWLNNFKEKWPGVAAGLGYTPAQVTVHLALCTSASGTIQAAIGAKKVANQLVATKDAMEKPGGQIHKLKKLGVQIKLNDNYTEAIGKLLGIADTEWKPNLEEYKPVFSVLVQGQILRFKFTKKGVDGVNWYLRSKGSAEWQFMGFRKKSQFEYKPDVGAAGTSLHLEAIAYGVKDDVQVGKPSDIVQILFGTMV